MPIETVPPGQTTGGAGAAASGSPMIVKYASPLAASGVLAHGPVTTHRYCAIVSVWLSPVMVSVGDCRESTESCQRASYSAPKRSEIAVWPEYVLRTSGPDR